VQFWTNRAATPGSQRGSELRPIGALAALHFLELRHHLAAGLGDVGGDGLALRLKAKAGSPLAIGRDPEIADKTGAGRGHGQNLGRVYHCGKRSFDKVIHHSWAYPLRAGSETIKSPESMSTFFVSHSAH
jgi:hypothetical protein